MTTRPVAMQAHSQGSVPDSSANPLEHIGSRMNHEAFLAVTTVLAFLAATYVGAWIVYAYRLNKKIRSHRPQIRDSRVTATVCLLACILASVAWPVVLAWDTYLLVRRRVLKYRCCHHGRIRDEVVIENLSPRLAKRWAV